MDKEGNFGSGPLLGKEEEHSYGGPRPQGHAQQGGKELSGFGLRNQPAKEVPGWPVWGQRSV